MKLNDEQGRILLIFARNSIVSFLLKRDLSALNGFEGKSGIFVTLNKFFDYDDCRLRGCVGYIEDIFSVKEGVIRAARSAAFFDPRFRPLTLDEIWAISISISLLTKPKLLEIRDERDLGRIRIGKDGLIVDYKGNRGLLLPVVAVEQDWDAKQFLEHCCLKAGLNKDAWKEKDCKVFKFNTQVFSESRVKGYG